MMRVTAVTMIAVCAIQFISCGSGSSRRDSHSEAEVAREPPRISIAEQYGLAYAPVQIARVRKLVEAALPGIEVEWRQLGNTAAIREAMIAGKVDVGFVAVPPFLIGRDGGMEWRIIGGLSRSPLGLVTWKESISSIGDLGPADRIALPQPASVQHILLAMAAEQIVGNAGEFDQRLVTMAHPDAMTALLTRRDVSAHFASSPYLGRELAEKGMRVILTGEEAFGGPFTFIVGVATEAALTDSVLAVEAVVAALAEANAFIAADRDVAATLLAPIYGIPAAEISRELSADGLVFSPELLGIDRFASFMFDHAFLRSPADPIGELIWRRADAE